MKIALYTIFRCTNYGALLQAYALAKVLRRICGEDSVDVLNHRMDPRDNHLLGKISNPSTPWFQRWRNRRKAAKRYVSPDLFEVRRQKTVQFIDEEIRPTKHLYKTPFEMREMPAYKIVVVGSDQIWNPVLNHDFGMNQYLAECLPENQKRVAYAASFGVSELPPEFLCRYAAALRRFGKITVREKTGAKICESLLGASPEVVLDPTMLLAADEWSVAAGADGVQLDGDYLAAYWVRRITQADVDAMARLAKEKAMRVRLMSAGPLPKLSFPDCIIPAVDAGPLEFVRILSRSSAVVTDSFHGLQFSFIFRKPFLAVADLCSSGSNASRLVDFCGDFGIVGGVKDIGAFASGAAVGFSDPREMDEVAFAAAIGRSNKILEGLVS